MKKGLSLLIIFLLNVSMTANAFAACSTFPQVAGEHIATRAAITASHAKTDALVSFEALLIRDKIEWTSSLLQREIRSQTASIEQMFKTQNQFLEDLMKSIAISQEEAIIERTYGKKSIPKSNCNDNDQVAIRNGVAPALAIKALGEAKKHTQTYTKRKTANDAIDSMLSAAPQSDDLIKLLSSDTIPVADQKKAIDALIYLTDQSPPRELDPKEKKGIVAAEYERIRKIRNLKIAFPQKVFADYISDRLPTLPLQKWATDKWKAMGGTGPVPGVVNGEISSVALTNFFVDSRIANPNWLSVDIIEMNEVGLARESLYLQAVELYMKRKQNILLEQIALMLAFQLSNDVTTQNSAALNHLEGNLGN